jgi:hypothetical protein|tara:strand:+ start:42 stop:1040 length:999 start_codon:yes stop_codon:yes gene_type:complete
MSNTTYYRNDDSLQLGGFYSELMREDAKWINHPILQRDPSTWSPEQEYFFIDSLFHDFVVNPITVSERGSIYRILEGGHRVHTIKKFMGNELKYQGMYFREMPIKDRDTFNYRKIRYTIYGQLQDLEEEQFILRVNMGLPINSGEFINMMPSIKLCELSRVLGERHRDSLLKFTDLAGTKNLRGDTSMAMYMILSNFIKMDLVQTERITSVLKLREDAEKYRNVPIDSGKLSDQVDNFMKIFQCLIPNNGENYNTKPLIKWPRYIIMTVQSMVMKYPDLKPERIHEFMKIVHKHSSRSCTTQQDWKARVPDSHVANKKSCDARVEVFKRWYT